jgi:hypothetical protein
MIVIITQTTYNGPRAARAGPHRRRQKTILLYTIIYYYIISRQWRFFFIYLFSRSAFACMLLLYIIRALCRRNRSGSRVHIFWIGFDGWRAYGIIYNIHIIVVFRLLLLKNNDIFDLNPHRSAPLLSPSRIDFKILVDPESSCIRGSIGVLRHAELIRLG